MAALDHLNKKVVTNIVRAAWRVKDKKIIFKRFQAIFCLEDNELNKAW